MHPFRHISRLITFASSRLCVSQKSSLPRERSSQTRAPRVPFHPSPFTLHLSLCLLLLPILSIAASTPYDSADFKAAETQLRDQLQQSPTNPALRHNLSLNLSQQDRWPEATAHALSAYLLNPRQAAAARQLRYTLSQASLMPAPLAPFLEPNPDILHRLALQLSPARWQQLLLAATALATLLLIRTLHQAYHPKTKRPSNSLLFPSSKILPATRYTLLAAAIALCALATSALHTYGTLSDPNLTLITQNTTLRSIPTDLDTPQKTTPVNIGHTALLGDTFLNDRWQQVTFPNAQTGWLRPETQTPIYK